MWTVTITNDTDNPDLGTVTATHTDGFVFSARANYAAEDAGGFIEKAISLRRERSKARGDIDTMASAIAEKLNAADPA